MRVAILVFQRNEGALLKQWFDYHSTIVPPHDIYVFDNLSDDTSTISNMDHIEKNKGNVLRGWEDFEKKGAVLSQFMRRSKHLYDWFVPLDCDEFLTTLRNGQLEASPAAILERLATAERPLLRVDQYILNVPHTSLGYRYSAKKLIVRSGTDVELDKGYHRYDWHNNKDTVEPSLVEKTDICYLHFHNKPFPDLIRSAQAKMRRRVPDFTRRTLERYTGEGQHLIKYFFMSPVEYLESLERGTIDMSPAFERAGVSVPFT